MKFAFSSAGLSLPIEMIAAIIAKHGYDGAELNFPDAMPAALDHPGAAVCCLGGGKGADGRRDENVRRGEHISRLIRLANRINCPLVKVTESPIPVGQNRTAAGSALGDWLLPLADEASDHSVKLVLENSLSHRTARETWTILDRLNHPSVGTCLDLHVSAQLGDSPQVTVPMLNSRIAYVQARDVKDLPRLETDCDLGEGVVPIKTTINRLRGVGYSGWLAVQLPPSAETAQERLASAIARLRSWNAVAGRTKTKARSPR